MFSRLTKNIDPSKLTGIRIGAVGLLMAIAGFTLLLLSAKVFIGSRILALFGTALFASAFPVGFVGMAVHFYMMFKTFVRDK